MVFEFDGTKHGKLRGMRAARRAKHPDPVRGGTDFTRAAHAVGVCERPGKAWRNGRTRSTGRNGRPLSDRYRGGMDKPGRIDAGHLCMDGRIAIVDLRRAGSGVRAIARAPGGAAPTRTPTACRASTPPKGTDPSGYTEEHPDAIAMEPDDRPRKTPDHMKPSEKPPEPIDDTATSTPTDTTNTNCQQRRCNDH
ncbi:hypothetical protein I6E06_07765 [Bifidobacterium boum]|uniref:hypothetical protein n=1 Tax=Bifidobacterium boum TaxID=78343 RepID=UPI001F269A7B|nr:hypothetical protein [Bifidobacterium boum]MCF2562344.1 hypothetical protein [Bifidobacterium boum]